MVLAVVVVMRAMVPHTRVMVSITRVDVIVVVTLQVQI